MKKQQENIFSVNVDVGTKFSAERNNNSYFSPDIDIYETDEGIFIELELPGVSGKDIKVLLNNHNLLIKGKKICHHKGNNTKYYMLERPYGFFEKIIALPDNIYTEKIEAIFKEGVLLISAPFKDFRGVIID